MVLWHSENTDIRLEEYNQNKNKSTGTETHGNSSKKEALKQNFYHWRTILKTFEICMIMSEVKLIPITSNQSETDIGSRSNVSRTIGI